MIRTLEAKVLGNLDWPTGTSNLKSEATALHRQALALRPKLVAAQLAQDVQRILEIQQEIDSLVRKATAKDTQAAEIDRANRLAPYRREGVDPLIQIRHAVERRDWKIAADMLQETGDPEAQDLAERCSDCARLDRSRGGIHGLTITRLAADVHEWCDNFKPEEFDA